MTKRKLYMVLEDFQESMLDNMEEVYKKHKSNEDEPQSIGVDDKLQIISDKKMFDIKNKNSIIQTTLRNGINYTNFESMNWKNQRLLHEADTLTKVGRMLELSKVSKNDETRDNSFSMATKLIDRRLNALALVDLKN
jgi:hypothetical protein